MVSLSLVYFCCSALLSSLSMSRVIVDVWMAPLSVGTRDNSLSWRGEHRRCSLPALKGPDSAQHSTAALASLASWLRVCWKKALSFTLLLWQEDWYSDGIQILGGGRMRLLVIHKTLSIKHASSSSKEMMPMSCGKSTAATNRVPQTF